MIYLKDPILESYELMLNENNRGNLTPEQIEFLNKHADGWRYNSETGLVDCELFMCDYGMLSKLPVQFGKCARNFLCNDNLLTTLEGCPNYVGGYFNCSYNKIASLKGCPIVVGGGCDCGNNLLTSLEDCPKYIGGYFNCRDNMLKSITDLFILIDVVKKSSKIYSDFDLFTVQELRRIKHLTRGIEEV